MMDQPSFDWDEIKNLINQRTHKVSFETAQRVFEDPRRVIIRDNDHEKVRKDFSV
jgi:uncharacterized DUF497 family protein